MPETPGKSGRMANSCGMYRSSAAIPTVQPGASWGMRVEAAARRAAEWTFPEDRRYAERSSAERLNVSLMDESCGRHSRMTGHAMASRRRKGILALAVSKRSHPQRRTHGPHPQDRLDPTPPTERHEQVASAPGDTSQATRNPKSEPGNSPRPAPNATRGTRSR